MSISSPVATGATTRRGLAPDMARGFMLLLIALAHAPLFIADGERAVLFRTVGEGMLDPLVNLLGLLLIDNRAYPLFAFLLGYGMAVIVRRRMADDSSAAQARQLLSRRGWFLLVFGIFNAALIHAADILGPYGLVVLMTGWLAIRPARTLLRALVVVTLVYLVTVPLLAVFSELFIQPIIADAGTSFVRESWTAAMVERLIGYPFGLVLVLFGFPLVAIALIGIRAGQNRILENPHEHRRLLARWAGIGLPVSLAGAIPLTLVGMQWWSPEPVVVGWLSALHIVSGVAGGLAYAALFGLAAIRLGERQGIATRALAATGQRSLTCYLWQAAVLAVLLSPALVGLGNQLHNTGVALVGLGAWASGLVLCATLARFQLPGPADWLLRRLVYSRSRVRG